MMRLVRQIVVLLMLVMVPLGAFAQRRGQGGDKRPPKEPVKVIENRKDKPPPPKNDRPKRDDRKRPNN